MVDGKIATNVIVAEAVRTCDFLKKCPVFERLDTAALMGMAQATARETHSAGDTLVREGEPAEKFYVVRKGTLELRVGGETTQLLKTGDFFGHEGLLTQNPSPATVVAVTPAELFMVSKADFHKVLAASPALFEQLRNAAFRRQQGTT